MGFLPAKLLPSCESMCVCCPALRPSSRRPVKRYKKLLAEIFPKTPDGAPNERKIMKLCESMWLIIACLSYQIAKFLEQRSHKELRASHVNFVGIITEAYSKLLFICKEQMAYFAISLVNVLTELLESKQENIHILGCQTLARFINSQVDNTYARSIESLVRKVCALSHQQGQEHNLLRAASLQCLSAMIWFMKEHSYIFADFDEIVQSVLENYRTEESIGDADDRHASQHNWVDEIVRSEGRPGFGGGNDVNISRTAIRLRPARDSSALTREERQSPEVWSHICVQKLAELAKESTTMRRILDPMLSYFDMKKQWAPQRGLAFLVLSDMAYLEKISGDLCKHLRKTLEAVESGSIEELSLNESLQNFLEDCLIEVVRGINDVRPLYDMMAIALENLPSMPTVARATLGSLLILSHIVSLTSVSAGAPMVFPEALLQQILKSMVHPDIDTRVGAHHMFSAIVVRGPGHPRSESEYLYETKKQSRTTSVFASATALLEKLRREKENLGSDKPKNVTPDDETKIAMLTEDQTNQLFSAFWIQANQTDNTPFNYEAIGHSYSLTVLSSRLKNSSNNNIVQFFQLPLSLRSVALTPGGKMYHNVSQVDPYLRIGDDLQLYVRLQSDLGSYGSENDQEVARSVLSDCKAKVGIHDQRVLDVIASALSNFTKECSRTSSVDCGLHESPITNTASSISKITLPQSVPHVLGVGQLLESALHVAGQVAGASVSTSPLPYGAMTSQCEALGLGTRKKLSSWLVNGHESTPDNPMPSLPSAHHSIIPRMNSYGFESIHHTPSESCSTVKLPPASPFDNFLKVAYRTQPEM
ncbi:hypothetical protein PR202_ga25959 [Eleusine coracana subsp. coracana]|uniref:ARM repeat superfamily protein n=1 Tax=Eleusine coracana subsp. coracana TaxID=191504 RepID=A0AAV5DCB9_ELECO|nr:hypothetical protein PR202_ga25959 [Eleusine coracana subsp. coracana]